MFQSLQLSLGDEYAVDHQVQDTVPHAQWCLKGGTANILADKVDIN